MTPPTDGRFRLSAHLGYLFHELPFAARFEAARNAGFRAIEVPDPYNLDRSEFGALCQQNDLAVAQIVLPSGGDAQSAKGLAALPGHEAQFEEALMRAIDFATAVNCRLIHPMSGNRLPGNDDRQWSAYLSNVSKACSAAADQGLWVIIEPISAHGIGDYFMNSPRLACAAIDSIGASNLLLSLDTYHAAATGTDLPSFISLNSAKIAHVQVADWPGRHEPGSGNIDFDAIFMALRAQGYKGYVGMEYIPASLDDEGFGWIEAFADYLEPLRTASIISDPLNKTPHQYLERRS